MAVNLLRHHEQTQEYKFHWATARITDIMKILREIISGSSSENKSKKYF